MAVPPPRKPVIPPLIAPQVHNEATQALSVLLMHVELLPELSETDLYPLRRAVDGLADAIIDGHGQRYDAGEPVPVRDVYYAHPVKVAEVSMLVAWLAGGGRAQLRACGLAAMLMNVSYTRLFTGIDRAGPLDAAGRAELRLHPERSHEIVNGCGLPDETLLAIAQHHERWDGSGYPAGLRGKEATIFARIVGAADAYVALCSPRPHRPPHRRIEVDELFIAESGTLFDPEIVRIVVEMLPERYERHLEAVSLDEDEDAVA
jgi:HD-GYP domain-containing protein (c-di-GMP phosphodiesterase class II)